ncbi:MAG: N-acetylmuramidase family protein [Rubrivivax sp.]|jgi:hypothetical protein
MNSPFYALFEAVANGHYPGMWAAFQTLDEVQSVEAATSLGPTRLKVLLRRQAADIGALTAPGAALQGPAFTLPLVLAVAFGDRRHLLPLHSTEHQARVRVALTTLRSRRAAGPRLSLAHDLSNILADPSENKAPLNDANFAEVATRHNITVAAIKAVAEIESGGRSGFDSDNRPKILFEAHHFRKHSRGRFNLSHPHLSCERATAKRYYAWPQYARLYEAMLLDPVAATKSASWGKFQVLGSNHNGWPDPISFAVAMQESEANHLRSFEAYCVQNGLMAHLRNKDWAGFAKGYNGKNYKEYAYDTKIAAAYKRYGGT